MPGFVTPTNEYYEGDRRDITDREIPQRPAANYVWEQEKWTARLEPDWQGLESDLRNTSIFFKAFVNAPPNAFSLLLNTISNTHNLEALPRDFEQMRARMKVDYTVEEIKQVNSILTKNNFNVQLPLSRMAADDPAILLPAQTEIIPAVHGNFRNSAANFQIVKERTLLKIDGLGNGSFNKMGWDVWDAANSKIRPQKVDEIYLARLNSRSTSSTSTVITIELDVAGVVVSQVEFQPKKLNNCFNSNLMDFYTRENFVFEGGALYISATNEVRIDDTSMHLKRDAMIA